MRHRNDVIEGEHYPFTAAAAATLVGDDVDDDGSNGGNVRLNSLFARVCDFAIDQLCPICSPGGHRNLEGGRQFARVIEVFRRQEAPASQQRRLALNSVISRRLRRL